jgi:hypothetical integral membrane protein (TIGR02206 family)
VHALAATTAPSDPLLHFHAFSMTHAAVLVTFAVVTSLACALGRRWRGTPRLARAEWGVGLAMLGVWLAAQVYWFLPGNFSIDEALPIHMCDLTGLIAPLLLLTGRRALRALLYFWGIGLSINALLTPVLTDGPGHVRFWLFFLTHAAIIGTAVYDLVARGYRPDRHDWLLATGGCAAWLAVVLAVDLSLGVNYGYVGNVTPERPTVIDQLGPWPGRVFKMVVAVLVLFTAMWLPFEFARRRWARGGGSAGGERDAALGVTG